MSNAALRQPLIGTAVRQRLAGFVATLRDNGFAVGLAETQDALAILSSPLARRSSALEPALRTLFCTTHSDWQRFGEVFRAFWLGQGVRHIQRIAGTPANDRAPLRRLPEIGGASPPGPPEQAEARRDGPSEAEPTAAKAGGAARPVARPWPPPICAMSPIPTTWRRSMPWPSGWPIPCGSGWCGASGCDGAAGASTCGAAIGCRRRF